jgi:ketol-acid reductoisomerase
MTFSYSYSGIDDFTEFTIDDLFGEEVGACGFASLVFSAGFFILPL